MGDVPVAISEKMQSVPKGLNLLLPCPPPGWLEFLPPFPFGCSNFCLTPQALKVALRAVLSRPASPQASLLLICPVRSLITSRNPEAHCVHGRVVPWRETDLGILERKIYISAFLQSFPAGNQELGCLTDPPLPPACCPCVLKCQAAPTCRPSREWQLQSFPVAQQWCWQRRMEPPGAGPSASVPKP